MYRIGNKTRRIVAGIAMVTAGTFCASTAMMAASNAAFATTAASPNTALAVLSPESEALRTALAAPDALEQAATHYGVSGYQKIWFKPGGDDGAARALITALEAAPSHGLPASRYDLPLVKAALEAAANDPAAAAQAELRLTRAYLDYARDITSGLLEPRSVDRELHVYPERVEPSLLLAGAASSLDMAAYLEGLAPQSERYTRLRGELTTLLALAPDAWGAAVPDGPSIRIGETSARVAAMRARLTKMGDHQPVGGDEGQGAVTAPATQVTTSENGATVATVSVATTQTAAKTIATPVSDPAFYDEALEESVRAFQRRHGLNDDGIAGRRTVAAMNVSIQDRIGQVIVGLERLRWLNKDLGDRHVYVNQADFTVQLFDGGEVAFEERVVIGKAREHRTPEFSDQMTYMVFNPIWHVPYSIATEEILPKLQEDPEYLLKKNMRLLTRDGGEGPDATLTDWSLYSRSDFPYLVKQGSGGGNALGRVKFMFPNQFAIYLHDTPSKRLFNKDARAFSHGCVRVRDPMAFARALLAVQTDDTEAFVQRQLAREGERRVNLKTPVPVHLTYLTAWVDDQGVWQFRDDIYGRDGRILAALMAEGVVVPSAGG